MIQSGAHAAGVADQDGAYLANTPLRLGYIINDYQAAVVLVQHHAPIIFIMIRVRCERRTPPRLRACLIELQ
ncbi:GDP-D-mannose dehydratase [Bradyrhizobium algeriense]|uniref:GDP-D-mannose dehydratase n=1 Tax=Bradyrhizobium algeriense TaxID=634784 RepID=A0ABU8BFD4_9BRAD